MDDRARVERWRGQSGVRGAPTGTNLGEPTISPDTATDKGAYDLSGAKFTTGGSIYSFTLNSVQSLPGGAYITLDFATKR